MKNIANIEHALETLAESLVSADARDFVWKGYVYERERALGAMEALTWVLGQYDSEFEKLIEFVELKTTERFLKTQYFKETKDVNR